MKRGGANEAFFLAGSNFVLAIYDWAAPNCPGKESFSMKEQVITAVCPLCGNKAKYHIKEGFNVLLCDIDDTPGCDEYFVIKVSFRVEYQTFKIVEQSNPSFEETISAPRPVEREFSENWRTCTCGEGAEVSAPDHDEKCLFYCPF